MVDTAILHQVLHYAPAPDRVVAEVARVLAPDGVLMIVDFAPHDLEELRTRAAHARLGFSDDQIMAWFAQNGVELTAVEALSGSALTVKIWMGCQRHARVRSIREATGTFR
jgi:ArsR family transcriptional regulator